MTVLENLNEALAAVERLNANALRVKRERDDLRACLEELVYRCDRDEGMRADGSNIDTCAANYLLERIK